YINGLASIFYVRKQAKSLESDGSTLASRFENCESKEEIERAYAKVLDDVMNGKIELEGLGTDRLRGTQSDVARVNAYILRAAKSAGVNVELVSGDTIKKNCDRQLNGSDNARDMLCDFNEALNRFSVTGEELVELAVRKDETSKVYQTAVAKTEGLSRNADPRLLEDAVGVYARLKEVHEHRTLWQKISHPIRNYRENAAIKKMEATLVNDFGMSREQLDGARANALAVTDDPISREARKAENFERALEARKQAAQRSKERLDIIRNKIARINRPDVVKEAPAPQVNANPAAEKAKEKKELAENINRLKNFSEPQFKRFLNTALKEERKDLEKSARKHAKDGVITEAKKAEINQKVEDLKTELIQLHVDPKAYINDLNSHALDMKKSSMEKAVIEAVNNKETRDRLKKEHKEHEEVRAENAQMIKEREELRVEYFKAAGLDERYDLDSAQRSAEDKTLLQMKEKMNFTSKLGADVSEKTEKKAPVQKDEPAVKQPVAEQSLEKK
ncbi:MAG: hypothetical protein MJ082_02510, partial [Clostridia bacterium]|nr:hypothetical protein [Clostridia bacterium]